MVARAREEPDDVLDDWLESKTFPQLLVLAVVLNVPEELYGQLLRLARAVRSAQS